MKTKYIKPIIRIESLSEHDVIKTSNSKNDMTGDDIYNLKLIKKE